jgi:apolipoprotein D and lipocalin family protein
MTAARPLAGAFAVLAAACAGPGAKEPLRPVGRVELPRYMGSWRIIACMDNAVERDFVDAVETYTLRPDGRIGVHFSWREKFFTAPEKTHDFTGRVTDPPANARWRMRLFPLFSASYVIIAVHPQYEWAAVAHPSRKFGWVLARHRSLPDDTYREIMSTFAQQGYDTERFIKVPQVAER